MKLVRLMFVFFVGLGSSVVSAQGPPPLNRWTEASQPTAFGRDNGLQSDNQGDPFQLTWGIFNEGSIIFNNLPGSNLEQQMNSIYAGGRAEWQPIMASSFDRWASISGLSFTFEPNDDGESFFFTTGVTGARADIRIGGFAQDGPSGVLANAWSPNRDITFDTADTFYNNTANNSQRLRTVLAHEIGHVLGMPHVLPSPIGFLMQPSFNSSFDGPQLHDIMVAQWGYGDALEKSNFGLGNDDFATATALGNLAVGSSVAIGEDGRVDLANLIVGSDEIDFFSIDDETDIDTFRFTLEEISNLTINLEALGFDYLTGPQDGPGTMFNSRDRSDLSFELFDSFENSLSLINSMGLEGTETGSFSSLSAGDYFLKIYGVDNADTIDIDTQFYALNLAVSAIPEPSSALVILAGATLVALRRRR